MLKYFILYGIEDREEKKNALCLVWNAWNILNKGDSSPKTKMLTPWEIKRNPKLLSHTPKIIEDLQYHIVNKRTLT